jgi:hypothetical protein
MKLKTFFKQYNFYVTACKEEEDFFVVVVVIKYNSCNYTKKFFLFAFLYKHKKPLVILPYN